MRGRGSLHVPDAQRRHVQGQSGFLAGERWGSRGERAEIPRREVRGIRYAGDQDGAQHRHRWRRKNRLVQGYGGEHPGDQPTALNDNDPLSSNPTLLLQSLTYDFRRRCQIAMTTWPVTNNQTNQLVTTSS